MLIDTLAMGKRIRRIEHGAQASLLVAGSSPASPEVPGHSGYAEFLRIDRSGLFVGQNRVDAYLRQVELGWVVDLASLVGEIELEAFRRKYQGTGRRPHHPHVIMGLVVYGALFGKTSLRELEHLALVDVGAWWICAGHQPDHSAIGRFLRRHADHVSDQLFVEIARSLLARCKVPRGTVAIDGTTIEAAVSRMNAMKSEAIRQELDEEKAELANGDGNKERVERIEKLEAAASVADERQARRAAQGKEGSVRVAVDEPEAVNQPLKNGLDRPSYKAVLSTHESGYIVGQTVEPSSENAALPKLMRQHTALFGAPPQRALLDSGFFAAATLTMMVDADVDVLCPPPGMLKGRSTPAEKLGKELFEYDPGTDTYRCPGQQELVAIERGTDRRAGPYTKYGGADCNSCRHQSTCTKAKKGRTIKRFAHDDLKEAMRTVLSDPRARREYSRRQHIAETPNATIKNVQGLTRFRRRGLRGAKLEIAIHCMALNLGRAAALLIVATVDGALIVAIVVVVPA